MYIQRHTNGERWKHREKERDREREREREACRSILCAASTRSHPSPQRAATMNPWIDCSLFTLEHSHIMAGPPLDVVDYPLSSKLNLSDWSRIVRMISHRSCSFFRSKITGGRFPYRWSGEKKGLYLWESSRILLFYEVEEFLWKIVIKGKSLDDLLSCWFVTNRKLD